MLVFRWIGVLAVNFLGSSFPAIRTVFLLAPTGPKRIVYHQYLVEDCKFRSTGTFVSKCSNFSVLAHRTCIINMCFRKLFYSPNRKGSFQDLTACKGCGAYPLTNLKAPEAPPVQSEAVAVPANVFSSSSHAPSRKMVPGQSPP